MTDYRRATKEKFTTADLKQNETLQDKVASWHFSDIDKAIDKLGDAANDYDHDGLKTVAHLGGYRWKENFVRSEEIYNPKD